MADPNSKAFLFMYPIPEYFDWLIERSRSLLFNSRKEREYRKRLRNARDLEVKKCIISEARKEADQEAKTKISRYFNACIEARYIRTGFSIYFALFDGHQIWSGIQQQPNDTSLYVGMTFSAFQTKKADGTFLYPSEDYILDQLPYSTGKVTLRIAGFHASDCVERVARRAYERGLEVLVDEDLTEHLPFCIEKPGFRIDRFPSIPLIHLTAPSPNIQAEIIATRKEKPWLAQWEAHQELK